jgi:hypothetical protein
MTNVPQPVPKPKVLCPICVDYIDWPDQLYQYVIDDEKRIGRWDPLDLSKHTNAIKHGHARTKGYVLCPNPSQDTPTHYLPVVHRDYGEPIVIGLVGRASSGKTHLLVAMVSQMLRGDLSHFGLTFEIADRIQHRSFAKSMEMFNQGRVLQYTDELLHSFASYLLVRQGGRQTRPLIFFDVAGEDFRATGDAHGRAAQYVLGANALLFVDDPARGLPGWHAEAKSDKDRLASAQPNMAFEGAISRLFSNPAMKDLPIAVALTKADELRYEPPVDHWLRRDDTEENLDAAGFRAESRDVYAVLARYQARPMLSVYSQFRRGTMHFVSATGAALNEDRGKTLGDDGTYARGVRPTRVLRPILALLAMTGVIDSAEALKVGL